MTEFNDAMKNVAVNNIVSFLQNPEGKSPLAQVSLILETVQNAFVTNDIATDAQTNLVRFLETYIQKLSVRTEREIPDFLNGIIAADTIPTISSVAQILARLRCNAVKESHSDFIINHLTYFIEYLKNKYGATVHVCKKFRIAYSDYSNVISEVTKWAFEAYNPPIFIQFSSKDEWEDFRTKISDEGHYACQFNGSALALTRKTSEIDKFDSSKFPMEVRIKGTKEFSNEKRNLSQEEINARWFSIRGYKSTKSPVETIRSFIKENNKVLRTAGLSIIAVAVALWAILSDTEYEKLEARQEICDTLTAEGFAEIGNLFYGSGPILEGNYSVKELYKLSDILKDGIVERDELSRSIYRKWKHGTDCMTLWGLGIQVRILLVGEESETLKEFKEERLNNTDPDSWMVGKWEGSASTIDFYGNITNIVMILEIDKYGNATQLIKSSTGAAEYELIDLEYDRRAQKLYYKDGGHNISIDVNARNKSLKTGDIVLHKAF